MKKSFLLSLVLLISISTASANPFSDEWIGEFFQWDTYQHIRIQPKDEVAYFRIPFEEGRKEFPIKLQTFDHKQIKFSLEHFTEQWNFQGSFISKNQISGTWENGEREGTFVLYRRQKKSEEAKTPFLGHYVLPSGKIFIARNASNFFSIHSPVSHQMVSLRKIGENLFYTSSGEKIQFSDLKQGQFQALDWTDRSGQLKKAQRFDSFTKEEVSIATSKEKIAGSLFLPNRKGKHPACLIVQGAGAFDRSITDDVAEIFAAYGIATLSYDKPGTGKSSGTVFGYTFEEKRDLNFEIFDWLKKHPKIDGNKIGLKGGSQGGRIATMVAAGRPETAFLIVSAAPMESLKETRIYAIHQFLRQNNFSEEIINEVISLWKKYLHQVSESEISTQLVSEIQQLAKRYPNLHLPPASTNLPAHFLPKDIYNATIDFLPKVKCPILNINGRLDGRVPVHNSVRNFEIALEKIKHPDYTVRWYEQANHSFTLPGYRIASGYFMDQINWILYRVEVNPIFVSGNPTPEVVLPGLVSTEKTEYAYAMTPDEKTAYFVRRDNFFTSSKSTIFVTHLKNDKWSTPQVAPFSGTFSDGDPFITPDGQRLFFTSNRPTKKNITKTDKDIWYLQKTATGWSSPIPIPMINSPKGEYSPTLTRDGDLYFGSTREGGTGWGDIYYSKWKNGKFQLPENLGTAINSSDGEWGSCISSDGTFLIFEASGRPENKSNNGDLYISHFKNGKWTKAINIASLNSGGSDLTPKLSPDGKYLYFASNRHPDIKIEMKNEDVEVYKIPLIQIDQFLMY